MKRLILINIEKFWFHSSTFIKLIEQHNLLMKMTIIQKKPESFYQYVAILGKSIY